MDKLNRTYQLMAFDMDGTVLNDVKQITPDTQAAIREALGAGKDIVFCSGRAVSECRDFLALFPEMNYLVCECGAFIYDVKNKKCLWKKTIDTRVVKEIRDALKDVDFMPQVFSGGELYHNREQTPLLAHYLMAPYAEAVPKIVIGVDDVFAKLISEEITAEKINLYHTCVEDREVTRAALQARNLPLKYSDTEIASMEVYPEEVNKGTGLKMLSQLTGISLEDMVMVGDADNDLDGLETAGLAIAMGNANDHVRDASDVVVADNNHDGCAQAIRKYLLGQEV